MSGLGTRTIQLHPRLSAFGVKADIGPTYRMCNNDAVDGAYTAASRWRRIIGSKGEI